MIYFQVCMRPRVMAPALFVDHVSETHDVVLTCPPLDVGGLADAIRARGNCPLDINGEMLAELPSLDLKESWAATRKLSAKQVSDLTIELGHRLTDAEKGDMLDGKLADAAAFFLLALRHNQMTPHRALQGCRVTFHADTGLDEVECLAR